MAKKPTVKPDDFAEVVTHLKYFGYDVGSPEPDGWTLAEHPLRYDIHVRPFPLGIRLNCAVHIGAEPGNSRAAWLEYLNTANERSRITQFSLFQGGDGLMRVRMATFISGPYNRQAFAVAMDFWHEDLDLIRCRPEFPADDRDEDDEELSAAAAGDGRRSNVH